VGRKLVIGIRVVLILALVPLSIYLLPRVVHLVETPTNLDQAAAHGDAYNPRLVAVAAQEDKTLDEMPALDQMNAALARVRGTDKQVAGQLTTLIGQIRGRVIPVLGATNNQVRYLLSSLDTLDCSLHNLNGPVDNISATVRNDRARLAGILTEARSTAGKVDRARGSAEAGANNVAGPTR
jgi:hypothetical protein